MPKTGAPETRPVSGLALLPYTQGATGIPDFRPPRRQDPMAMAGPRLCCIQTRVLEQKEPSTITQGIHWAGPCCVFVIPVLNFRPISGVSGTPYVTGCNSGSFDAVSTRFGDRIDIHSYSRSQQNWRQRTTFEGLAAIRVKKFNSASSQEVSANWV